MTYDRKSPGKREQQKDSLKLVQPSNVLSVQVVVSGDHGDTAFQFGVSVLVEIANNCIIDFKVSVR
jgi:hypothetical protein